MGFYDNRDNNDLLDGINYNNKIKPINKAEHAKSVTPQKNSHQDKKREDHKESPNKKHKENVSKHFKELSIAAEQLQKRLEKGNSPFRFSIYMEDEKIMIDKFKIDYSGKIIGEETLNITQEEFKKWITDFYDGEGLLFDTTG
jgi:uncharacterized FlaG/YvyC family protein